MKPLLHIDKCFYQLDRGVLQVLDKHLSFISIHLIYLSFGYLGLAGFGLYVFGASYLWW